MCFLVTPDGSYQGLSYFLKYFNSKLTKEIDMDQIDFGYVGRNGYTIYRSCFMRYLIARIDLKRPEADCSMKILLSKTETVFEYLVNEGNKYGFDVDSILEIPSSIGETCFYIASRYSEKISNYIIQREIIVNSITTNMMVPAFRYPALKTQMMKKGINPHVINFDEYCFSSGFETEEAKQLFEKGKQLFEKAKQSSEETEEAKQLFEKGKQVFETTKQLYEEAKQFDQFPRSVHFSIDDINCSKNCPVDCASSFKKFYFKNGEFVEMMDENRIGQGGFGMVFKGKFHGQDMALKCVFIGGIESQGDVKSAISDLERNISEIRIQIASGGSGIIFPEAFVRQQNQVKDEYGKWIAENYNIYIYPLYDCNLYELHENHFDHFTDEILRNIQHQCLTRKCSNRRTIKTFIEVSY